MNANPLLVACLGMFVLTCLDSLIKSLAASFPTVQIVFLRFFFAALMAGSVAVAMGASLPNSRQMRAHFFRACLMLVTASAFYYALGKLPLAELFVITFSAPIFTALFGGLILKEHVSSRIIGAIAVGFAGMLVMTVDPSKGHLSLAHPPFALFCAVVSPITYALGLVLLRSQATGESGGVIIGVQSAIVAILSAPLAFSVHVPPSAFDWGRFVLAGLFGTLGYFCFTYALKRLTASRFSVIEYTSLVWAALFGYLFFNETPRASLWLGAPLIIAGCLLAARDGHGKAEKPAESP